MNENHNKSEDVYEHEKIIYNYYLKERNETDRFCLEMSGRYEKFYMFIIGGAFIGSLTFVESIVPNPIPCSKWIIELAWGFLTSGMLLALWRFILPKVP